MPEFMNQANNFINSKDTLCALIELWRKELESVDKKGKALAKGKAREKKKRESANTKREEAPMKGLEL